MAQPELRRRMRGSDAMFLYFERKEMPLHIGCVAILDGPFDEESERVLAARLPEIPRYRQRVMFSPLNLTHPSWEYDPEFDIQNHIRRVKLDPPGSDDQLSDLAGQVFTPLMDRNKPLWDLTVVDGLEGGRSALICRVHHSLVDGVSGIGLVKVMFDPTREPRRVEPRSYNPPPLPSGAQLLKEGLSASWAEAAERFIGAQVTMLKMAQAFLGDSSKDSLRGALATAPDLLRPTERLPFNSPCSGVRGHCWMTMPFGEARAIRTALGGTINDVVLTIVTGAVSRYVTAHREPLKNRYVRYMVPVNLRTEDTRDSVGVDISMLPLSVPLDVDDAAERLRVVARRSSAMKAARVADVIQLIGTGLGWIPPGLQHPLAMLPFLPQPVLIVNMICTNVPGPMVPLYANGREVLNYYPHVPCGCDVGLAVAISSYNQNLSFGVTYDGQAAPDGELFRDFLIEARHELREAAGVPEMAVKAAPRREIPTEPVRMTAADLRAHRTPETPPTAAAPLAPEPSPEEPAYVEPIMVTVRVAPEEAAHEEPATAQAESAAPAPEPVEVAAQQVPVEVLPETEPAEAGGKEPAEMEAGVKMEEPETPVVAAEEAPPAAEAMPKAAAAAASRNGAVDQGALGKPHPKRPKGKRRKSAKATA